MPALSCFIDDADVALLIERLNTDSELAIIVADGQRSVQEAYHDRLTMAVNSLRENASEGSSFSFSDLPDNGYRQRWKAVDKVSKLADGEHCLWHVPAGPLPLLTEDGRKDAIANPWEGWTEQCCGADPTTPFFGSSQAVIRLSLWTRHRPYSQEERVMLPILNSFWDQENDFLAVSDFQWIGGRYSTPPPATKRWWSRLRGWLDRKATRMSSPPQVIWALPSAREKLSRGMDYYARGWEINRSAG
ncbi:MULTISPECIES: hypothetical protein [Cyanophyceae]|uniref:hypothetical protein n=1 Tax=Cyanophyceae TaxID=3028117 RepID=UPI001689F88E|nr:MULTISPECIES: hypothetical protein [Cyanophyceae]MBD1919191.1 hypothetical protein [Phormidium sp. FACHB-77]MBD2033164.1 hypothetical protein [Phormidium sp. FACHB-322]MBD2054138.1 hypothetical protein [Leptolyngbya sp. FACHB-60]